MIYYSEEDREFYTTPDGDKATHEQIKKYYDTTRNVQTSKNVSYDLDKKYDHNATFLQTVIYNVIDAKLKEVSESTKEDINNIMFERIEHYLSQFTINQLKNIRYADPEVDDMMFYLIYKLYSKSKDVN